MDPIKKWVSQQWKLKGLVEVITLMRRSVLFKFAYHKDMVSTLLKSPWMMGRKAVLMEKWHLEFDPSQGSIQ